MRLKHIKDADKIIMSSPYLVKNPCDYKGEWNKLFGNDNKIEIEVGTGKGKFIISKALENPNTNYIGIEKYDSPLVSAVKKLETLNINNLKLICFDAFNIGDVFDHEIDKIYLNFSDPWPKKRHEKRRLSSKIFLEKYDNIFKGEKDYGYKIIKCNTNYFDKFTTEYEDKFISKGKNINYISVVKE